MAKRKCPTDRLPLLILDELSPEESGHVLNHLEDCPTCQSELDTLSADPTWWHRTARGLSGVAMDGHGHLPEPDISACFIEALLEARDDIDGPTAHAVSAILDPPVHPEMLGRIDEFDIEEKIGQGGMGIVFRGFDRSLNRPVAVKVMAPHLGANGVARQRFAREAQAAAAIVHPHIVPIYRVNSSPDRPYIAMALIDGRSLQDHISRNGPLAPLDVVRVSCQIADGLAAANRQGLIHRDIKPANLLMEKDVSRVMITDFGLARAVDDVAMTQSGCLAGTPHYMSPEQARGADIDDRGDLFSLGAVMYFLATGREPFQAESAFGVISKITSDTPTPARIVNADIPKTLDRIIGRLLEKEPSDRIQSAAELQRLLTDYLAHLQAPHSYAQPQVKATRSHRTRVLRRIACAMAMVAFLLTLWGAGFIASTRPNEHRDTEHQEEGGHQEHENAASYEQ